MKKAKNIHFIFAISFSLVLLIHIVFLFIGPFFYDESFYASIPFRLVNGDSLIQDEWHLTQFSSLFSYLPVLFWMTIKNSVDGMFIFLRCIYLFIHTTIAITIYAFFRKYGKWAIMASLIFYIQTPYRILAISYQSMFVVFLLLLSLCLISIYEKNSVRFYIFAGICFGGCCVCNPLFCFAFVIYLLCCALWTQRNRLIESVVGVTSFKPFKKEEKLTKRQKRERKKQKQQLVNSFPNMEHYNCFFKKEAILWFSSGVIIIAVVAIVFFILTGGTVSSLQGNIENMLNSSEYAITSYSIFSKMGKTLQYFSKANLGIPWILPMLFTVILFDKNRKVDTHRFAYLSVSVIWAIIFILGVMINTEAFLCAVSLPFCVISTICYLLTENKNKTLFYCMYVPCLIASFFQYLAADTHLAAIGIVLAVNNVVGVFFAMDLWEEMHPSSKSDPETSNGKGKKFAYRNIIIIGFCIQILFYGIFYQYRQLPGKDAAKPTIGPYAGLYMTQEQCDVYNKTIHDLDIIKEHSQKEDPVLIVSYNNWMYIYLERPFATYTTWFQGNLDANQLKKYYRANPEKVPKYIYIESQDANSARVEITMDTFSEFFEFTKEDLSNGVLLIVK